jgi:ligand-binding sensor domain-containing protein/signal transduction histidine kinase
VLVTSSFSLRNAAAPILALVLGLALGARNAGAEQLPIRSYGVQDGLASDSVTGILRDSRGYLWFATTDGVSRFDGERFTSYGGESGLPHPRAEQVLETQDGTIWVATRGGLARYIPGRKAGQPAFAAVPWGGKTLGEPVYALYEDRRGSLWVGGAGRLAILVLKDGQWRAERQVSLAALPLPAGWISAFAETADGSLWIGSEGGLLRLLPQGRPVAYAVQPHHGGDSVLDLAVDGAGRLWIAHALGAFVLWPDPADTTVAAGPQGSLQQRARPGCMPQAAGEVCAVGISSNPANTAWYRIFPARDRRIWLATSRGLTVWDAARGLTSWGPGNGLPEPAVTAVAEDRAGNLWLGTGSSGALRLARRGFAGFTARDGLADARVNTLFTGTDGALYVRSGDTLDGTLFLQRFDGGRFTSLRPRLPGDVGYMGWGEGQTALQSRTGEWWLATGQGLVRYPAVPFSALAGAVPALFTVRDGLGANSITRLFEDSRGDLWIAGFGAHPLTRRERATGVFRTYGPAEGLPGEPTAFAEDPSGAVWIGLDSGGVVRTRGGKPDGGFTAPGTAAGLPAGRVHDLFVDHAGRLWVAVEDGGVGRLDAPGAPQPRFTLYTQRNGLSSADVRCLSEDALGRVYFGGRKGVDRLDPSTGRIVRFSTVDGLLDNVVDSALRDRAGNLWFGTRRGLSRLIPGRNAPAPPPATWITAVRVDGVVRVVSELGVPSVSGQDLEAESRLEVESLALDFLPGAALRYQHRMVGVDADWSEPAAARVVQYAELPEGWQRFEVRAVTREGAFGAPGVVVFHVEPPLWRRGWVLALAALGVTAAGIGFYRYRSFHQVSLERMRTRIATDLHDDLGSSLTRVSILSEVARRRVADDSESSRLLNEIGGAAREMIEALGENIWAIDPRRDDLRSFVTRVRRFAGGLLDGSGIAWHLRAPQDGDQIKLSPVERRQLYLLVKEALHNAARHSQATTVDIQFAVSGRRLSVEIRDNGRGFDPAALAVSAASAASAASSPEAGGHGLGSLRARAAALGARLEIDTAPGQGTRLFLEARLPAAGA